MGYLRRSASPPFPVSRKLAALDPGGTRNVFGAIIIGDEILSGKRQDKHFPRIVERLKARGLGLSWSMNLPDDPEIITPVLTSTLARADIVFSFGGIGATPDDHTRQCAAQAAGVGLQLHPDATRAIEPRYAAEAPPQRIP